MRVIRWVRSILGIKGRSNSRDLDDYVSDLQAASRDLSAMRGDNVTPGSPDTQTLPPHRRVAAAAREYGLSRFSGETEALPKAAEGYRPSGKRRADNR